jgi:hypothetical protein
MKVHHTKNFTLKGLYHPHLMEKHCRRGFFFLAVGFITPPFEGGWHPPNGVEGN